jgi:GTP cyclohydrolase I
MGNRVENNMATPLHRALHYVECYHELYPASGARDVAAKLRDLIYSGSAPSPCESNLECLFEGLLSELGFDLENENFSGTPERVARFWLEFTQRTPPEIKTFPSDSLEIVRLNNYETWGLCPHHLLPVRYQVSICYQPNGQVFGISKLPRIVDYLLRTMPLQEDIPRLVVKYLQQTLSVRYAECSVEGLHLCMTMRGVKAKDCTLTTTYRSSEEACACNTQ